MFKGYDGPFSQTTAHFPLQLLSDKESPLTTPALETDTTVSLQAVSSSAKTSPWWLKPHISPSSFRSLPYYEPILQFFLLFPWDCAKTAPFWHAHTRMEFSEHTPCTFSIEPRGARTWKWGISTAAMQGMLWAVPWCTLDHTEHTQTSRTYLRGSSKRTVAAQWNTTLTRVRSSSSSSALMASLGWVSSALIGLIFSWKLGQSSRTLSKTLKHKQREIRYRIRLLRSLWLAASLITSINANENSCLGGHRWDNKIVHSPAPSQGKQNKNIGGNARPWRD